MKRVLSILLSTSLICNHKIDEMISGKWLVATEDRKTPHDELCPMPSCPFKQIQRLGQHVSSQSGLWTGGVAPN